MTLYDEIGQGYTNHRQADSRLVDAIFAAVMRGAGGTHPATLVDVGAGTGNYSRALADRCSRAGGDSRVIAIEPSRRMLEQCIAHPRVDYLQGDAAHIPLVDAAAQAATCVLAIHHVSDLVAGLREIDRVTGGGCLVIAYVDPREAEDHWLRQYFPEVEANNSGRVLPIAKLRGILERALGRPVLQEALLLPRDYTDLFCGAAWGRPELFLDPTYRASSSSFVGVDSLELEASLARLRRDLANGSFATRYPSLATRAAMDVGLRLLTVCSATSG